MSVTRRQFLGGSALVGASLVLDLSGCGESKPPGPAPLGSDDVLLGLYRSSDVPSPDAAVTQALARLDWTWLKRGQSVLVKLASNSPNPHPAVTSPAAVRAVVAELKKRGATRVVVADQAGAQWVRLASGERRFSSTRERVQANGLLQAITDAGAEAHFFDDQGYDAGYFEATPPDGSHWTQPLMIPQIVKEVDHIVYLPRLSSHVLCGCTIGHKMAMGFLRDDSRYHVHHEATNIYEKYVEISWVPEIRQRFRLAVTLAESMMLHNGPDSGDPTPVDPRVVIASRNLAHHDVVATALLVRFNTATPVTTTDTYRADMADASNQLFVETGVAVSTRIAWGPSSPGPYQGYTAHAFEQGLDSDRALARAFALAGGVQSTIRVVSAGAPLADEVGAAITTWSGNRVQLR
jgi:uncharacterized protein (DUF362 family)